MNSVFKNNETVIVLLIALIMLFCPLIGFVCAILCFRDKWAAVFIVLFSFYFGWFHGAHFDLLAHYNDLKSLNGLSLFECFNKQSTLQFGREPYHILFKYFILKISDNPNFFSACACFVYTLLFIYGVLGFVRKVYANKFPGYLWPVFFLILFIVEFYKFSGVRFWPGFFVFLSFYLRYLSTDSKKYLILSFSSIAFHFSLIVFCMLALINELQNKNYKIQYIIIGISLFVKYLGLPIVSSIAKLDIFKNFVNVSYQDESIINHINQFTIEFRETGNIFYLIRSDVIFISALFVLYVLCKYSSLTNVLRNKYWSFILWLYSVVNIGYSNITFYDRFYQGFLLILFIFFFVQLHKINAYLTKNDRLLIFIATSVSSFYAMLTAIVVPRDILWSSDLWFNSFLL